MLNSSKDGLAIFDNFRIDWNLPKHRNGMRTGGSLGNPQPAIVDGREFGSLRRSTRFRAGTQVGGGSVTINNGFSISMTADGAWVSSEPASKEKADNGDKPSLMKRIFQRKKLKAHADKLKEEAENAANFTMESILKEEEKAPELTVEEFFKSVKNSQEEITLVEGRLENYKAALEYLTKTGQIAVREVMEHDLEICRAETQSYAMGLTKVITEEQLVEFAKKSPRALKLDWIANFTRQIPSTVIDVKVKADEKEVFDNYVILHYDPMHNGSMETLAEKKEREDKKKDPILFGVVAGSYKLYFIGDWIDEYCDLRFDKLVEILGKEAIEANNITAHVVIPSEGKANIETTK